MLLEDKKGDFFLESVLFSNQKQWLSVLEGTYYN